MKTSVHQWLYVCAAPQKGEWVIRGNITTGVSMIWRELQKWCSTDEIIWGSRVDVRRQLVLA